MTWRNKPIHKLYAFALAAVFSLALAGCGGGGGTPPVTGPTPDEQIKAAQDAAKMASDAAKMASDKAATAAADAKAAVDAVAASKDADVPNYTRAQDAEEAAAKAASDAMTAAAAAKTASDAAMVATTVKAAEDARDAAKMAQTAAEEAKIAAEAAEDLADGFADMVADAQKKIDDDAKEAKALSDAQEAAMKAAAAARTAANNARTASDRVAELAPGSAAATAAEDAATAAEEAATAAEEASDRAQEDTTSADAKAEQKTAEGERDKAQAGEMTAKNTQDRLEDTDTVVRIGNARNEAKNAYDRAKSELEVANGRLAAMRADLADAKTARATAVSARTDVAGVDAQITAIEADLKIAEAALLKVEEGETNAKTAYEDAMAATTAEAAEEARDDAKAASDQAYNYTRNAPAVQPNGIGLRYNRVDDARKAAQDAAAVHTLRVLRMANRYPDTDADTRKTEVGKVAVRIGLAAESTGNRNDSRSSGSVSVSAATWNANTPADPDADPPTKEVPMYATVTITGLPGSDVTSAIDKQQVDANNDGDYDDDGDTKANARVIAGLPGFSHGLDVNAGNDERVIVFTDIEQQKAAVPAVTLGKAVNVTNKPVVASQIVLADNATTLEGATYDHDGDSSTTGLPITTLECKSARAQDCSSVIEDGKLKSLVGYVVTAGAGADFVLKATQPAVADSSYLTLGFWIDADSDNDATNGLSSNFGAFVDGGSPVTGDIENVVKGTGTATYKGVATGVHTQGSSVDYFQGDAELDVDFGDADVNGTIKGTIDNITAGGVSKSDVITLSGPLANTAITETATITNQATFSGVAHMGAGTTKNNITTYTYDGSWSGRFYNAGKEPDPDPNAGEIDVAPLSAAGTFGVTGTDDMGTTDTKDDVTTSYVGAFGAHKQ